MEDWTKQITALESFFKSVELPTEPIRLSKGETITDVNKMIKSHLVTIKTYNGKQVGLPYLDRLEKLKLILKKH